MCKWLVLHVGLGHASENSESTSRERSPRGRCAALRSLTPCEEIAELGARRRAEVERPAHLCATPDGSGVDLQVS